LRGDQIPRRQRLPGWNTHHVGERGTGKRLLHGVQDLGPGRLYSAREVRDEVFLRQPPETLIVGEQVWQGLRRELSERDPVSTFPLTETATNSRPVNAPEIAARASPKLSHIVVVYAIGRPLRSFKWSGESIQPPSRLGQRVAYPIWLCDSRQKEL